MFCGSGTNERSISAASSALRSTSACSLVENDIPQSPVNHQTRPQGKGTIVAGNAVKCTTGANPMDFRNGKFNIYIIFSSTYRESSKIERGYNIRQLSLTKG